MIQNLPDWILPNMKPSCNDLESATAIEMVYKLYGKNQELITDYNDYVKQLDSYITDFTNGLINDFDCFKSCIIKTMDDYIESIDTKMSVQDTLIADKFREQDETIANAINYMKNNIVTTATAIVNQAIENGDISVAFDYDPDNESLDLIVTRESDE